MSSNALLISALGLASLGGVSYYLYNKNKPQAESGLTSEQEQRLKQQQNYQFGGKRRYQGVKSKRRVKSNKQNTRKKRR